VQFAGVSEGVADELRRTVGAALLLPNGIDLAQADAWRLSAADAKRALGLSPYEFNIGVVGRLHPKKNPRLAVEAFRRALPRLSGGVRLVFVGAGQLESEVSAAAADLPVLMKGFVPDAGRLMAGFDLLVMPSGEREAFGMVALEAMAAGVPVLCGTSPGPRFVTGDTGMTFDGTADGLAAALVRAQADRASGPLDQLAERARRRVEETFSVAAAAARLREIAGARDRLPYR
jgi:glycosyltransferase involved in cell wall biosynthesis